MRKSLFILLLVAVGGKAQSNTYQIFPAAADRRADSIPLILNNVSIYNDSSLAGLFQKLFLLKKGEGPTVNVVHLGDSHVQMGYFAESIRNTFAGVWGRAGFGTIFPYQIARYKPFYVQTKITGGEWKGGNYLEKEDEFKYGVMGFTAKTYSAEASLEINVRNSAAEISGFNKVHLLFGDPSGSYSVRVNGSSSQTTDTNFVTAALCDETAWEDTLMDNKMPVWQNQVYCFNGLQDKIQLSVSRNPRPTGSSGQASAGGEFNLYGLVLEDTTRRGVVYNNCGVGGSQFSNLCNNASLSVEQLASLHPDLIIFSYGSNESYMKSFDSLSYQDMVINYVQSIKNRIPDAAILLTTPPDTRFKNLYPRNTTTIQKILKTAAEQEGVAFLDMREQMGGDGSVWRWLPAKLAAPDKLHFTKEGYTLQANLLMQAFLQSYNNTVPEEDKVPDLNMGNYLFGYTPDEDKGGIKVPDKIRNK